MTNQTLSGPERCAVLLYSLGMEQASSLLKQLSPEMMERVSKAAKNVQDVNSESLDLILTEFKDAMSGRRLLPGETSSFINTAIEETGADIPETDPNKQDEISLDVDGEILANLFKQEHPQTIAVVLANLPPSKGAEVLSRLSEELRLDVIQRLATLSSVSKSVLRKIMNTMDSQIRQLHSEPIMKVNGVEQAASILKLVPQSDSSILLENLARQSGQLFDAIKRLMFTIDDLVSMDDRGLRNLMKQVDNQVLGKALKVTGPDVRDAFFRNMSERAANMLQEDIESLPPMPLSEVEEAQGIIVEAASALIDEGKAVIAGLAGGEALV